MSPADLLAFVLVAALALYALGAGADFGGGVLDLFARGERGRAQRDLIAHALGPIWEANHVWLVLVVVVLFVGFPAAFSALMIALHVPVTLLLAGIVLRGAAFTFRTYDAPHASVQRRWSRVFAIGSILAPVMLGVCVGAVVSGRLRLDAAGDVQLPYEAAWFAPLPFALGLLTLAHGTLLASVYLLHETHDEGLRATFRRRALVALAAVTLLAWGALLLARTGAPRLAEALLAARALGFHAVTGAVGLALAAALLVRRDGAARALAVALTLLLVAGWARAQYPLLIVPDLTVAAAAAPESVLRPVLAVLAAGAALLFPALGYLFWVFKRAPQGGQGTPHP